MSIGNIGLNDSLPWSSKSDLKHFKNLTNGKTILVGYNTKKTLPTLKNRTIIVDDKNSPMIKLDTVDWCLGGKKTYEKYCHLYDGVTYFIYR